MGSPRLAVMGAVLSSIPLCSRAGDTTGATTGQETDNRPEDRQPAVTVVAQPLSVQLQSNTSETCTATGIDNENHRENQEITEKTNQVQEVEPRPAPAVEEPSQEPELEEDDGNVEVSLDDSQSDEWSLEKEVEGENDSQEKVEEVEVESDSQEKVEEVEDQEPFRKTSPELDTAAAITNILSEIVGGDSNDSRAVVGR